jgi:hypothetical protein
LLWSSQCLVKEPFELCVLLAVCCCCCCCFCVWQVYKHKMLRLYRK